MALPEKLLQSLKGVKGFDEKAFVEVHSNTEQITSVRLKPVTLVGSKERSKIGEQSYASTLPVEGNVPWSSFGFYLAERPSFTFDPLFHAGCYYVQEASSMFLEQALKQTLDISKPLKILDLSAAPGGKSTHIQSDRKSTRLNSSHLVISYAVFCLK